jgi:hypothetical protein
VDTEGRFFFGKMPLTPKFLECFNEKASVGLSIVQDTRKDLPLSCLLEPMRFRDNEFRKDLPWDYVYWVFGSMKPFFEQDDGELLNLTRETAATEAMRLVKDWNESFRVLFELQDVGQRSVLKGLSAKPEFPVWESDGRVTLVGMPRMR